MSARKSVAMVQSCYIPWKGYFDLINSVDHFLFYDDAEYSKNTWRNRNRAKTANGPSWLTIPVAYRGRSRQRIDEVEVSDPGWRERHWKTLSQSYARTPFFDEYAPALEELYLGGTEERLSLINRTFVEHVCELLGIGTELGWTSELEVEGASTERVVRLCEAVRADVYLSGPTARDYLDVAQFERAGIEVAWMDYDGYPEYPQPHPPFEHAVTALDLLFCTGPTAQEHMKSFPARSAA